MDRSFEVYSGHALSSVVQKATRNRIDWLCDNSQGKVLDIGCSQGITSWLLAHKGYKVVAIDKDKEAVSWAKNMFDKNASCAALENVEFICADFLDYRPEEKFDSLIAGEYIEHLSDRELLLHLEHMAQLLATHGKLLLTTPFGFLPHPDHHQSFFADNLSQILSRQFHIAFMDVEDGWIKCLCTKDTQKHSFSPEDIQAINEKGKLQQASRTQSAKHSGSDGCSQEAPIRTSQKNPPSESAKCVQEWNWLQKALARQGFFSPFIYDENLFSALNTLYRTRPLVPLPRKLTPDALFCQADRRVKRLQAVFTLEGKRCLEIGCGRGETAAKLGAIQDCSVDAVDIRKWPEWEERVSENVKFHAVDLTSNMIFQNNSFDFIYSFSVFEYLLLPLTMLTDMYNLLKPGGDAYLMANLYRGPMASHRYREIFFPWPHLLFDKEVFTHFYEHQYGRGNVAPARVNKLTHLHYLEKTRELGFEIVRSEFSQKPFDQEFYKCFEEKLGVYPKEDLEKDFIMLYLKKPG